MSQKLIKQISEDFNLSKTESFVLDSLFLLTETKVIPLSRKTSLPRQTLYSILNRLQKLGLVVESRIGKTKTYSVNFETVENALKSKQESLSRTLEICKIQKEQIKKDTLENSKQKIAVYKGKLGISHILNDMTKLYKTKKFKTFRAYTMSQFKEGFEEDFKKFIKTRSESEVESRIFVPKGTDFSKILGYNKYKREFKVLEMEDFGSALYIVGNRVYIVSFKDNQGFVIENQNIALFLKEIFDIHWKNIK